MPVARVVVDPVPDVRPSAVADDLGANLTGPAGISRIGFAHQYDTMVNYRGIFELRGE
jgi:hypothetical protein